MCWWIICIGISKKHVLTFIERQKKNITYTLRCTNTYIFTVYIVCTYMWYNYVPYYTHIHYLRMSLIIPAPMSTIHMRSIISWYVSVQCIRRIHNYIQCLPYPRSWNASYFQKIAIISVVDVLCAFFFFFSFNFHLSGVVSLLPYQWFFSFWTLRKQLINPFSRKWMFWNIFVCALFYSYRSSGTLSVERQMFFCVCLLQSYYARRLLWLCLLIIIKCISWSMPLLNYKANKISLRKKKINNN